MKAEMKANREEMLAEMETKMDSLTSQMDVKQVKMEAWLGKMEANPVKLEVKMEASSEKIRGCGGVLRTGTKRRSHAGMGFQCPTWSF
jgi:hypothetical protein